MTTLMPYICVPGWTLFMSADTPGTLNTWKKSGPGDTEAIAELRNLYGFCAKPTGIQCRTKVDKLLYTLSLDFYTVCTLEKGFECLNSAQGGFQCEDYEVSFHCVSFINIFPTGQDTGSPTFLPPSEAPANATAMTQVKPQPAHKRGCLMLKLPVCKLAVCGTRLTRYRYTNFEATRSSYRYANSEDTKSTRYRYANFGYTRSTRYRYANFDDKRSTRKRYANSDDTRSTRYRYANSDETRSTRYRYPYSTATE
ncbi:hypothetical protein MAR_005913 [Mya arenaria]|uniref:WxxW domain-containing protein n=1 Tax=Mya arenaria TaxID=6604 RepID=A0ABY7D6Z8_MYAAR|nr:hypothetical protein MAR_005913 [Mya arenaria]